MHGYWCLGDMMRASVLLLVILAISPASGAEVILSPPGGEGWRALTFPKISRHTTYTLLRDDGFDAVKAHGDCSASALYVPAEDVNLERTPRLQWRWKVERGLPSHDERVKSGDDFAARTYVMFRFDPEHASFWQRAQHALGKVLYGDIVPGNAINYVWSSREAAGSRWDNPYTAASKMVSMGSGTLPQWTTQVVDVAADYRDLFGHEPPAVLAVAVMTDTDNSCQQATAYYADFRFIGR